MEYNYAVRLEDCSKLKAVILYREITGVGLQEAKDVIDNIPGIIFDNISLSEANNIATQFQEKNCEATVCKSSRQETYDASSRDITNKYEGKDVSTLSYNELLVLLKRVNDTIFSAEKLQTDMERANKAVENVEIESKQKETSAGPITFVGMALGAILGLCILAFIGAIVGFFIGFIVAYFIDNKVNEKKYLSQAQQYYDENYPAVEEKRNEINDISKKFFNSSVFAEAQELIPPDYFDCESIDCITRMVGNRRADTLKEAINMYEDHLYKNRIEEMQRQQVIAAQEAADAQKQSAQAAQQQVEISQRIARNTKATARATRLNTFVNIIKK